MKKIALIAAALLAGTAAQAQTTSQIYGEAGYVFLKADVLGAKANPSAIRGIVGWDVHQYVALELMLAGSASDDTFEGTTAKGKVENSYGLFVKPKFALNSQVDLFGRIGFANSKLKISNGPASLSDDDSDFAWGLGVSYKFSKQWYGSVDYTSYYNKDSIKIDGFALNVGYRF